MCKIQIAGIVSAQTETRTAGEKTFSDIVVKREYKDEFGEVTSTNLYNVTLVDEMVEQFKPAQKVKIEAYLKGQQSKEGRVFMQVYAKKIEKID